MDKLFYVADQGFNDMNFDIQRWQLVMDNLLMNDNLQKTFQKAFTEEHQNDDTVASIL